jgi:hypothetical protein
VNSHFQRRAVLDSTPVFQEVTAKAAPAAVVHDSPEAVQASLALEVLHTPLTSPSMVPELGRAVIMPDPTLLIVSAKL